MILGQIFMACLFGDRNLFVLWSNFLFILVQALYKISYTAMLTLLYSFEHSIVTTPMYVLET